MMPNMKTSDHFLPGLLALVCLMATACAKAPSRAPTYDDHSEVLPTNQNSTTDVLITDLNGDGELDLVWVSQPDAEGNPGGVEILVNQGHAEFEPVDLSGIDGLDSWSFVLAMDMDGDGDQDLILSRPATTSTQVTVLMNSGVATFARYDSAVPHLSGEGYGYVFGRVAAADVDRDGDLDLLVPVSFDTTFAEDRPNVLLLNEGDGYFTEDLEGRLPPIPALQDFTLSLALGDVNGDGAVDVFLGEAETRSRLLINDGAGFFTDESDDATLTTGRLPADELRAYDCRLADLDGDGDLDLVVINDVSLSTGDSVLMGNHVLLNDGTGHFSIVHLPPTDVPHDTRGLAIGDLDQDGVPDLVLGNATDTVSHDGMALEWLRGLGDGTFAPVGPLPTYSVGIFGVAVGDLDGDGYPDIAAAVAEPDPTDSASNLANLLLLTD
jgi:FG-GAP-like repeat